MENNKQYIYCNDKDLSSSLKANGYKLLNTIATSRGVINVFEYNKSNTFSLDFDNVDIRKKCIVKNQLTMAF